MFLSRFSTAAVKSTTPKLVRLAHSVPVATTVHSIREFKFPNGVTAQDIVREGRSKYDFHRVPLFSEVSQAAPAPAANEQIYQGSHGSTNITIRTVPFSDEIVETVNQIPIDFKGLEVVTNFRKTLRQKEVSILEVLNTETKKTIGYSAVAFRTKVGPNLQPISVATRLLDLIKPKYRGRGIEDAVSKATAAFVRDKLKTGVVLATKPVPGASKIGSVELIGFSRTNPNYLGYNREFLELELAQQDQTKALIREFYKGSAFVDSTLYAPQLRVRLDRQGNVVCGAFSHLHHFEISKFSGPQAFFIGKVMPFFPYSSEICDGELIEVGSFSAPFYRQGHLKDFVAFIETQLWLNNAKGSYITVDSNSPHAKELKSFQKRGLFNNFFSGSRDYYAEYVGLDDAAKKATEGHIYPSFWDSCAR